MSGGPGGRKTLEEGVSARLSSCLPTNNTSWGCGGGCQLLAPASWLTTEGKMQLAVFGGFLQLETLGLFSQRRRWQQTCPCAPGPHVVAGAGGSSTAGRRGSECGVGPELLLALSATGRRVGRGPEGWGVTTTWAVQTGPSGRAEVSTQPSGC